MHVVKSFGCLLLFEKSLFIHSHFEILKNTKRKIANTNIPIYNKSLNTLYMLLVFYVTVKNYCYYKINIHILQRIYVMHKSMKVKKNHQILALRNITVVNLTYGEGNGNPLQYACLGNPMDRGAWQATMGL